ncbi:hypothetical protein [Umezawaea sp. Da 62-37]|uniref:hypothetical protein n=1 Tax=Umezawaea sp. Da 62-37 TaxID=3075927 RepID=UPI0037DC4758
MPFIGSVDCAALPRADGLGLPVNGTLLFFHVFLHHEEDMEEHPTTEFSRVLYVPADKKAEVTSPPPVALRPARKGARGIPAPSGVCARSAFPGRLTSRRSRLRPAR